MLFRLLRSLFPRPSLEARRSSLWSTVRDRWIADHNRCEACGTKDNLNVHHERPFKYFPELELETSNFVTLCETPSRNCHLNVGHSGDWNAWNAHVRQDAALMLQRRSERRYGR